jgi:CRISPR/Cas system CSM-associated protein Csm3 (group 7 of RAMP superfamily)
LLDTNASGVDCVSDVDYYHRERENYERACSKGLQDRLLWIGAHTCDVCKLFGSPVQAARLKCADGNLANEETVVQVRDGVVLDRDSRTAVDGLKYDFETVQAGTAFMVQFDLDNPTDRDLALLGVALFEWHAGGTLGGFTSRGLGRFRLEGITLRGADLSIPTQRIRYLTALRPEERLSDLGDWQGYFNERIQKQLQPKEK